MTTLNNAIFTVITTKYKKDAKEAHAIVEEAGYLIDKNSGRFEVYNPNTRRRVYAFEGNYSYSRRKTLMYIQKGYYMRDRVEYDPTDCKFNFVGLLEKPLNEYTLHNNMDDGMSNAYKKYETLRSAKRNVEYESRRIDEIQKQIAKLQMQMVSASAAKACDEIKLNNLRKELGLK